MNELIILINKNWQWVNGWWTIGWSLLVLYRELSNKDPACVPTCHWLTNLSSTFSLQHSSFHPPHFLFYIQDWFVFSSSTSLYSYPFTSSSSSSHSPLSNPTFYYPCILSSSEYRSFFILISILPPSAVPHRFLFILFLLILIIILSFPFPQFLFFILVVLFIHLLCILRL